MLGPAKRLWVNTAAVVAAVSQCRTIRSLVSSFTPMLATWTVNPRGRSVTCSFPFDGAWGFGGDVVDDSVNAVDFVDDTRRHGFKYVVG